MKSLQKLQFQGIWLVIYTWEFPTQSHPVNEDKKYIFLAVYQIMLNTSKHGHR